MINVCQLIRQTHIHLRRSFSLKECQHSTEHLNFHSTTLRLHVFLTKPLIMILFLTDAPFCLHKLELDRLEEPSKMKLHVKKQPSTKS